MKLQSFEGFLEAVQCEMRHHDRNRDAYEQIENVYEHFFNKRRYASYEVFSVTVSNSRKKKK